MGSTSKILIAQSLYNGSDYFIFRPIGNNSYREIKFSIVSQVIIEDQNSKLHRKEREFISEHFFAK